MTIDEIAGAARAGAEPRAGGTDLLTRRRTPGQVVPLGGPGLRGVTWTPDGTARIGALTTLAELAADDRLRKAHPAVAAMAGAIATPQIRAAATAGGNLLQRNRCWYFRNPAFSCHQTGGDGCPARAGEHLYGVVVDQSPCAAPHPSSLAVALLAADARVEVHGRGTLAVGDLYDLDPARDHVLEPGELLLAIELPAPPAGARTALHRATALDPAGWALTEAVVRLVVESGTITAATVAAGAVARTPLRLTAVEEALTAAPATQETLETAAAHAKDDCTPLPQTTYKTTLLAATVLEALERALP